MVDKLVPSVLPKKSILETGLSLGFLGADFTRNLTSANAEASKFLASSKKNSIKLMFPNLDFSYAHPTDPKEQMKHQQFMRDHFDDDT